MATVVNAHQPRVAPRGGVGTFAWRAVDIAFLIGGHHPVCTRDGRTGERSGVFPEVALYD